MAWYKLHIVFPSDTSVLKYIYDLISTFSGSNKNYGIKTNPDEEKLNVINKVNYGVLY